MLQVIIWRFRFNKSAVLKEAIIKVLVIEFLGKLEYLENSILLVTLFYARALQLYY